MSEFDGIRRTSLKGAPIINPNESITQGFFQFASEASAMSQQYGAEAKKEAQVAGQMAGQNSVSMNADGTITRSAVQDAGKFYTEAYMNAQRTAAKGALETNIRQKTQEFLVEHQNDPDALKKFHTEFREGYIEPLLKGLNKDIGGQVGLMAEQVFKSGINTINDRDIKRAHETAVTTYKENFDSDIKNLRDLQRAGATAEAAALEDKIYGDMQDASQSFLTTHGIEAANREISRAKIGGELLAKTEAMPPADALAHIRKFTETERKDGLGYADRVQIAQEARDQIKSRLNAINEQYDVSKTVMAPKLRAVDLILNREKAKLGPNESLSTQVLSQAYKEVGIENPDDASVADHYYSNIISIQSAQDKILNDITTTEVFMLENGITNGTTSIDSALNGPLAGRYSQSHIRSLHRTNFTRQKALLDLEKSANLVEAVEFKVNTGQWTVETLRDLRNDKPGGFVDKNYKELFNAAVKYQTSDRKKASQARDFQGKYPERNLPPSLEAPLDKENLRTKYDGAFDISNEEHVKSAVADIGTTNRVPSYVKDSLSNWKRLVRDQETAKFMMMLHDGLDDDAIGGLPESFKGEADKIRSLAAMSPDEFAVGIKRYFDSDDGAKAFRQNTREKYFGENGDKPGALVEERLQSALNKVTGETSFLGGVGADMFGNSWFLKRFAFGANPGRVDGEAITPQALQGMLFTDPSPSTTGFLNRLNEQAYMLELSGEEYPIQRAMTVLAEQGAGMSRVSTFGGTPEFVVHSFEQAAQNWGFQDPSEVVFAELLGQSEAIKKIAGNDDFGGESNWTRLFDGTIGTDIGDQLAPEWRDGKDSIGEAFFKAQYQKGNIKVVSVDKSQDVFEVQLRLGADRPDGNPRVIRVPGLIRLDAGTFNALSEATVKKQSKKSAVTKILEDPGAAINTDFSRFKKEDKDELNARHDAALREFQHMIDSHEAEQ